MSNQPAHMWSFWRDKYGSYDAVIDYYPDDKRAQQLVERIKEVEILLDAHFESREEAEDED